MTQRLYIEFLSDGSLPLYELGPQHEAPVRGFVLHLGIDQGELGPYWEAVEFRRARVLINQAIDCELPDFTAGLQQALPEIGDRDGTFMFVVRALDDHLGEHAFIVAGLLFVEFQTELETIELRPEDDLAQILTVTADAFLAGRTMDEPLHAAIRQATLRYHDEHNPRFRHRQFEDSVHTYLDDPLLAYREQAQERLTESCNAVLGTANPTETELVAYLASIVERRRQEAEEQRVAWERDTPLREAREAERRAAVQRARQLLRECLSPHQLREYLQYGDFSVSGADGYTYLIKDASHGNVYRVEEGALTVAYCCVTNIPRDPDEGFVLHSVPNEDLMLAQKLLLERLPKAFFDKANIQRLE